MPKKYQKRFCEIKLLSEKLMPDGWTNGQTDDGQLCIRKLRCLSDDGAKNNKTKNNNF